MARTGSASPLEEHTGFEPALTAWKAAVLPLHQCSILPVCPGCHALLTSALPPCSPYGGAGLSLQSGKKESRQFPGSPKAGWRAGLDSNQLPPAVLPVHIRMCFPPV